MKWFTDKYGDNIFHKFWKWLKKHPWSLVALIIGLFFLIFLPPFAAGMLVFVGRTLALMGIVWCITELPEKIWGGVIDIAVVIGEAYDTLKRNIHDKFFKDWG